YGAKISLQAFAEEEEEAQSIVEQIAYARQVRRLRWSDHAILFRINAQSRPLETALRQAGVPYRLIGAQSFFDRREVRDFLAYLKTMLNPDDDISLLRIANVPARGLSDATMERLLAASHERKCSVFAVMKNPAVTAGLPGPARRRLEEFVGFVERTRGVLLETLSGLGDWADRFLDEIGYFNELRRSEKTPEAAESRIRNVQALLGTMDSTDTTGQAAIDRLQTFLEEISLDTDREEEEESRGNAVTLITIHSCKGL